MGGFKRQRSPHKSDNAPVKMYKMPQEDGEGLPAQQQGNDIKISVTLRSTSKASRNDYEPPTDLEKIIESLRHSDGDEDGTLPSAQSSNDSIVDSSSQLKPPEVQAESCTASSQAKQPISERHADEYKPEQVASTTEGGESETSVDENERQRDSSLDTNNIDNMQEVTFLNLDSMEDEDEDDEDDDSDADLSSEFDEFAEWEWLEQIDAFGTAGENHVAECDAKLIRRNQMRSAFWIEMEEPTEETSILGFELFDRYGRLNREYCEHEIKKGTGVWGEELDQGDILLFEKVTVSSPWRSQGIGAKIVKAILDETRRKSKGFFAFVRPGYIGRLDEKDEKERRRIMNQETTRAKYFWRSLGFRRVGTSAWLAFTDDTSHPSRNLDPTQDIDRPEIPKLQDALPNGIDALMLTLSDPVATGDQCLREVEEVFPPQVETASILSTDRKGNTILHIAAMNYKTEVISYILSNWPQLAGIRNVEGYTAVESLRSNMELRRTTLVHGSLTAVISDKFKGFEQSHIACVAALTGTETFDLTTLTDSDIETISSVPEDQISRIPKGPLIHRTLRLKYGCTCGECIGGFLSPRMLFALLCQAELQYDLLSDQLHHSGSDWVNFNEDDLEYLSPSVRENLKTNKSMREGFVNMCDHIARCLKAKCLPTERNVLKVWSCDSSEWPPVTKNYIQRGGTVAAVATMLFQHIMCQDEWAGDGDLMDIFEEKIKELPTCRNDHEFGFVSGMCGYKRMSTIRHVDLNGREIDS